MTDLPEELIIAPMMPQDVPQVYDIELASFTAPWDIESYYAEIDNPSSLYLVARVGELVLGFGGMWIIRSDAHIVTLAVNPADRRRGIGRQLLKALLAAARERHVEIITLEVRVSNAAALHLYTSFGFRVIAHRRNYYPDNGEDAAVMRLEMRGNASVS